MLRGPTLAFKINGVLVKLLAYNGIKLQTTNSLLSLYR